MIELSFIIIYFLVIEVLGVSFRTLVSLWVEHEVLLMLLHRSILLILVFFSLFLYKKSLNPNWKLKAISYKYIVIVLLLFVLFFVNNYYSQKIFFDLEYTLLIKNNFYIFILGISVSSIWEELMYRGFIQNWLDKKKKSKYLGLTKGNWVATILMFLTHLGFLGTMTPLFAISSLLLVFIFSITVGYLKTETQSLLLPIVAHLGCNFIHVGTHLWFL